MRTNLMDQTVGKAKRRHQKMEHAISHTKPLIKVSKRREGKESVSGTKVPNPLKGLELFLLSSIKTFTLMDLTPYN
jgi:hypothetical protein